MITILVLQHPEVRYSELGVSNAIPIESDERVSTFEWNPNSIRTRDGLICSYCVACPTS